MSYASKHYSGQQVLKVLRAYSGTDERFKANIEKLLLVDDSQQQIVADAVANLANGLHNGGPLVAFEVICEVSRLMARKH